MIIINVNIYNNKTIKKFRKVMVEQEYSGDVILRLVVKDRL